MAIHWQIKFKSLRADELYTVNIYDNDYSGDPVQLTGAAQPFVTQEDDTDDMFTPVRTQSGYLKIVDTGYDSSGGVFNWRDFIPTNDTDRPVTLTNSSGDTVWMGFMQAQNFGFVMNGIPQEKDFPLQCPLTVASRSNLAITQKSMRNFAYLLMLIVDNIPSVCRPAHFYFQGMNSTVFLNELLDWQNLADINDEDNHSKYNMSQCLDEICKFWGWTARIYRDTMYFICPDEPDDNFIYIRYSDLQDIAYERTYFAQNVPYTHVTFGTDIFASNSNRDSQMRGPNTAKITSNSNEAKSDVVSLFPDTVEEEMEQGGSYQEQYGAKRALFSTDMPAFSSFLLEGECEYGTESFNLMRIGDNSGFGSGISDSTLKTIRIKQSYSGNVLVSLETNFGHTFYNAPGGVFASGGLQITGDVYRQGERYVYADETTGAGKSHIYFRIGIGARRASALWYNGSTWVSSYISFPVAVGGTNTQGFLLGIRVDNPSLKGRLFIDILGSDDMQHESSTGYIDRFELVNLKVSFNRGGDGKRDSSREYVAHSDSMVNEEYGDNTIFASDNNLSFGYGLVVNPDGTMLKGIDYNGDGTLIPPEQHYADRIVDYWSESKRKMEVELLAHKNMDTDQQTTVPIGSISPGMKAVLDNTDIYPVSISHDWREDKVNIIFMEI